MCPINVKIYYSCFFKKKRSKVLESKPQIYLKWNCQNNHQNNRHKIVNKIFKTVVKKIVKTVDKKVVKTIVKKIIKTILYHPLGFRSNVKMPTRFQLGFWNHFHMAWNFHYNLSLMIIGYSNYVLTFIWQPRCADGRDSSNLLQQQLPELPVHSPHIKWV